jgi:ABC-type polysaccharide/polyol phosphate export permease
MSTEQISLHQPGPPRELLYRRPFSLRESLGALWHSREVVGSLAERQIRSRYAQALLGIAWSVITPFVLLVAFTLVFDRVAQVETDGVPYALFSFIALVPWTFFASSVSTGSQSIVSNLSLVNKVPVPREVFPISAIAVSAFDAMFSVAALLFLFVVFTFTPEPTTVYVPLIMIVQLMFTFGATVVLSILTVYIRDMRTAMPLALQFGLFVTPVAFAFDVIPKAWRGVYSFLNPLAPVIDSYRQTVLYGEAPQWQYLGLGALGAATLFFGGYILFKRLESGIADIA